MSTKDVIISVYGQQFYEGRADEPIELVTNATYGKDEQGRYVITYQESAITGLGQTTTTLLVGKNNVVLSRTGECPAQLYFEEGRSHISAFGTEGATATLTFFTQSISINLDDNGGTLQVKYTINSADATTGVNLLRIHIHEKQ